MHLAWLGLFLYCLLFCNLNPGRQYVVSIFLPELFGWSVSLLDSAFLNSLRQLRCGRCLFLRVLLKLVGVVVGLGRGLISEGI